MDGSEEEEEKEEEEEEELPPLESCVPKVEAMEDADDESDEEARSSPKSDRSTQASSEDYVMVEPSAEGVQAEGGSEEDSEGEEHSNAAYARARRGPSVWGTDRYKQLWQMACEVGEQQALEQVQGEAPSAGAEGGKASQDGGNWVCIGSEHEPTPGASRPTSSGSMPPSSGGEEDNSDSDISLDGMEDAGDGEEDLYERYAVTSIADEAQVAEPDAPPSSDANDIDPKHHEEPLSVGASSISIAIDDSLYDLD
eukprot:jgi/Tetstr1/438751/TSEL_027260.t1